MFYKNSIRQITSELKVVNAEIRQSRAEIHYLEERRRHQRTITISLIACILIIILLVRSGYFKS